MEYALQFYRETEAELKKRKELARKELVPAPETALEINLDDYFDPGLDFPKRPPWNFNMSREELDSREQRYFTEYVVELERRFDMKHMSYFELNLETWRQLWRVLELSDIVLVIVDIRYAGYRWDLRPSRHQMEFKNQTNLAPYLFPYQVHLFSYAIIITIHSKSIGTKANITTSKTQNNKRTERKYLDSWRPAAAVRNRPFGLLSILIRRPKIDRLGSKGLKKLKSFCGDPRSWRDVASCNRRITSDGIINRILQSSDCYCSSLFPMYLPESLCLYYDTGQLADMTVCQHRKVRWKWGAVTNCPYDQSCNDVSLTIIKTKELKVDDSDKTSPNFSHIASDEILEHHSYVAFLANTASDDKMS
ncbi:Guanine nucleotide-binding-like protein 1 [Homalodisca vitripennis]|nr:Guanine nucleotide-binding-like protein 1 [Homalodisca vitripennis]